MLHERQRPYESMAQHQEKHSVYHFVWWLLLHERIDLASRNMLRLFDFGVIFYEIKNGWYILMWLATLPMRCNAKLHRAPTQEQDWAVLFVGFRSARQGPVGRNT